MKIRIRGRTINDEIYGKSRFISIAFPVVLTTDFKTELEAIRDLYPKATHYCFAYRIDNEEKADDDGEPGRSAGWPILNVLQKNGISDSAIVVVRYFHAPKLGLGPLTRAYNSSAKNVLSLCEFEEIHEFTSCVVGVSHDKYGVFMNYLKDNTEIISHKKLDNIHDSEKEYFDLTFKINNVDMDHLLRNFSLVVVE